MSNRRCIVPVAGLQNTAKSAANGGGGRLPCIPAQGIECQVLVGRHSHHGVVPAAVGRLWGSSQMLRQGSRQALDVGQLQLTKRAMGAFTMAYNRSKAPESLQRGESVAHHMHTARLEVLSCVLPPASLACLLLEHSHVGKESMRILPVMLPASCAPAHHQPGCRSSPRHLHSGSPFPLVD